MRALAGLVAYVSKPPDMPEFGDGNLGPAVIVEDVEGLGTPIPERLLALGEYLEGI